MTSEIRVNKLTNRIGLSTVTFADSGIGLTVTGRIDPDTDSARDLGTTSVRWRNGYFDTLYGDGSNLTGISVDSTKIETGNTKVETIDTGSDGHVKITTEGTERLRIDSSGRLLFGITSSISGIPIQIASGYIQQYVAGNNATPGYLDILKTRNASPSGNTILQDGDIIGSLRFRGNTGSGYVNGSIIRAKVNGTPGSGNDLPTDLEFHTMPDGSGSTNERLRIDSAGQVLPGADNAQNLGSSTLRWKNIYSADLHCSNKGSKNDVDGTWGDYTIQEGESDLFLIDNRSGKKYKFNLTEVD